MVSTEASSKRRAKPAKRRSRVRKYKTRAEGEVVTCTTYNKYPISNCDDEAPRAKRGEDMSEWMSVKLRDIFSVEVEDAPKESTSACCLFGNNDSSSLSPALMICYAQRRRNTDIWECEGVRLVNEELSVLNEWHATIQSSLNDFKHRPKNMLIFVNPFGGKRKAVIIFEKFVKPVLELSGVRWTVINTQHRNHATETLTSLSQDKLFEFDAVVAVGGDGTACEVVTGLLLRNAETSASNKDTQLQPSPLQMGVIPAGSSNALAYSVHGTDDPGTAAIHLVLGGSVPLDVGAIHTQSGISRFFVTQMSYGHLADTLQESEKFRWMGPKRYDYAGMCKFLNHKAYEGSVEMKLAVDDSRRPPTECGGGNRCDDCGTGAPLSTKDASANEWKRVDGRFLGISAANISCRCTLSPRGMAPFAHLSDGHLDLILVRKASRLNHLRYLLRTSGDSRRAFALPFVERYHVQEVIFTPMKCCGPLNLDENGGDTTGSSSTISVCGCDAREQKKNHSLWNCDGELHAQPSVRVTVHRDLVRILARASSDVQVTLHEPPTGYGAPNAELGSNIVL